MNGKQAVRQLFRILTGVALLFPVAFMESSCGNFGVVPKGPSSPIIVHGGSPGSAMSLVSGGAHHRFACSTGLPCTLPETSIATILLSHATPTAGSAKACLQQPVTAGLKQLVLHTALKDDDLVESNGWILTLPATILNVLPYGDYSNIDSTSSPSTGVLYYSNGTYTGPLNFLDGIELTLNNGQLCTYNCVPPNCTITMN